MAIKFAIIKERKSPPDRRVVFSPKKCTQLLETYPDAAIEVESSLVRVFKDIEYTSQGIEVVDDVSNCDVLLGVKEVPIAALIPNKKYFFFSHTIKQQPYNKALLQAVLKNKIELYDHETIVKENGARLIGFGRYAGLVGAYNTFRALGMRDGIFTLDKVETLADFSAMKVELDKIKLPAIKIVLTGSGKVAKGAKEIVDHLNIEKVTVEEYLTKTYQKAVYCYIDVMDYNKKIDGGAFNKTEFFKDPIGYESNFMRFAKVSDVLIAGHFYGENAPYLFTRDDAKQPEFHISVIGDISCDIDGPVASTLRASTIADPLYGYQAASEKEVPFKTKNSITVMAVDNLPCELPKDASEGFGRMFFNQVIPAFFNNDKDGILERAKITTSRGTLTDRFSYLTGYIEGQD